jgi:CheR methyltransferase, SAM binding domain
VSAPLSNLMLNGAIRGMFQSKALRLYFGRPYLRANTWIWRRLPVSLRSNPSLHGYGSHVHSLIQLWGRTQSTGTYFFRKRPELELLLRLLNKLSSGSTVDMAILGCSKGAEVYSFSYAIRTQRPALNLRLCALDISKEALEFAEAGGVFAEGRGRVVGSKRGFSPLKRASGRHHVQRSAHVNLRAHVRGRDGNVVRSRRGASAG